MAQIKLERQGGKPSKTLEAKLKNVGSFWLQWETTNEKWLFTL